MSGVDRRFACPLCGERYNEVEGRACRPGCPIERGCKLLRCPDCGYEMPAPGRLTRFLARWFGDAARGVEP